MSSPSTSSTQQQQTKRHVVVQVRQEGQEGPQPRPPQPMQYKPTQYTSEEAEGHPEEPRRTTIKRTREEPQEEDKRGAFNELDCQQSQAGWQATWGQPMHRRQEQDG